jgi:glyoxylase-like metal-dependent hydrolase (beta-lactamase superfamily II)
MSRTLSIRLSALALLLAGAWAAYTQQKGPPPELALNKVKDDLYVIQDNGSGNVAVYLTNEGTILVDDKFERNYDGIMQKVKSVTDKPVKYVMSTHHHGDHTGSSAKFLEFAEIVAHKNNRANMVNGKQPGVPRIVFSDEASVFLGGKEVRAHYFGRGHTNGDAVIYFPALRTIHTGDLMAGTSPLIDYGGGGSVKDWTGTLDGVMKEWDFDTVIPGHGAVTNKAGLMKYRDDIVKLRDRVGGLIRSGKGKDDVSKVLASEFAWDPMGLPMRISLDGLLTELKN